MNHDSDRLRSLTATNMTKRYGQNLVLDSVTVRLEPGTVTGLVGHNGAGKSTLLRCLAGAEQPDGGEISVGPDRLQLASPAEALAAGLSCVYQELSLVDCLTVSENVFLGRELTSRGRMLSKRRMVRTTAELIDEFGIGARPGDLVSTLSVAQRQLVEVATAIRRDVKYLLLDEPTTALEPDQVQQLLATIKTLVATRGLAVLLVDHKLDEVFAVADSVICLANGKVVLDRPAAGLDRAEVVRAIVGHTPAAETLEPESSAGPASPPDEAADRPRIVLEAKALTANRMDGVDLAVRAGQIVGVYGLMGSGRSRFLRTIMCDEPRTGGELFIEGRPATFRTIKGALKAGIAYVPEERKANGFIPGFNSLDNVVLPVLNRYRRFGFIDRGSAHHDAMEVLKGLSIRGEVLSPTSELSGGNQQKVLFGRATLQHPRILLLDEPTKGVDIGAKNEIHSIIRKLARNTGAGIILVSSEEEELLDLADIVCVFREGRCDGATYPVAALRSGVLRQLAWSSGAGSPQMTADERSSGDPSLS